MAHHSTQTAYERSARRGRSLHAPRACSRRAAAPLLGAASFAAALVMTEPSARAADDGAYGRLDGDLELRAGAGAALAAGGPALCARAAIAYLATAGVYAHYIDALGASSAPASRSFASGIFLQPMFLGRYAKNLENGPARLDLFVDSVALGVGAFWEAGSQAGSDRNPGLELSISVDLPLFSEAQGPFLGLRGALRWRDTELAGADSGHDEQRMLLSLTLSWHQTLGAHLVDTGDRRIAARPSGAWPFKASSPANVARHERISR
jgi:hypothetical protein